MIKSIINSLGGEAILKKAIENNLTWLNKSFAANNNKGSSAYANVFGKWSPAYPETTGYLLPTLVKASEIIGNDKWLNLAEKQFSFFQEIQNDLGWFVAGHEKRPMVFDNSQILLGICLLIKQGIKIPDDFKLFKSYEAILSSLDDQGAFTSHNFIEGYNPSYYARIVWALLVIEKTFSLTPNDKVKILYKRICQLQNKNLSFNDCAFAPGEKIFTHTIGYTVRGLWESARLLGDRKVEESMRNTVDVLDKLIEKEGGRLAGSYDLDWKGDFSFICSVGHCQLALLKLLLYKQSGKKRFLNNVDVLLNHIMGAQRRIGFNNGAVPSSIPVFGAYQRFKYTNWTQKFFLDALIELLGTTDPN